ncbi:LysR family transcriptional regulator [Agarivorans sp. MS3-6]
MKSIEFNLIPVFVAIYEEKNLTKAANRLSISQPAVSKSLSRLRDIYDEPLFHRNTSGVEPTTFAMDIYPAMLAAQKNFASTLVNSRSFEPKISDRIFSIACVSPAYYQLIPKLFQLINKAAPNISLEVHPLFTEDYESDLRLQRHDLIIDMMPRERTLLSFEPVLSEDLVVVCSADHPRIGSSISIEQFLAEEHVVISRWHARRSLLGADDFGDLEQRRIVYRAPGALEMLPVIEGTELIGMLPESTIKDFANKYKLKGVPLPFDLPNIDLCMIWHPSRSNESAHQWLRAKLKTAAKQMQGER